MKGHEELITNFQMRQRSHASRQSETHFTDLWSRSNIKENFLLRLHYVGRIAWLLSSHQTIPSAALFHYFLNLMKIHVPWWLIAGEFWKVSIALFTSFFRTSTLIMWHDESPRKKQFWWSYHSSASLFVFRGSPTIFSQFVLSPRLVVPNFVL